MTVFLMFISAVLCLHPPRLCRTISETAIPSTTAHGCIMAGGGHDTKYLNLFLPQKSINSLRGRALLCIYLFPQIVYVMLEPPKTFDTFPLLDKLG